MPRVSSASDCPASEFAIRCQSTRKLALLLVWPEQPSAADQASHGMGESTLSLPLTKFVLAINARSCSFSSFTSLNLFHIQSPSRSRSVASAGMRMVLMLTLVASGRVSRSSRPWRLIVINKQLDEYSS